MEDKLKLKNGRELKVTFHYAEGLSKEEGQRRWKEVYDLLFKLIEKQHKMEGEDDSDSC